VQSVEAEGGSIDEAIAAALARLGVERERVEVEILANATRGFLGFGGQPARIRATLRARLDAAAPALAPASAPTAVAVAAAAPTADTTLQRAREVLSEIIRLIGAPGQVETLRDAAGDGLVIQGDPSGLLIGRGGQTLDALEFVVNRIVGHEDAEAPRLSVDANGYRARRRAGLEEQARRAAARARSTRRAQTLAPLPPRDRRIVHLTLRDDPAVSTRSVGEGPLRRVVVAPTGRRQARESRQA
jgi:spoIIIJ-associated protein